MLSSSPFTPRSAAGDAALRSVSTELTRVIRPRDTSYRYGGEEFLVIMPDASLEEAAAAAERIRVRDRRAADPCRGRSDRPEPDDQLRCRLLVERPRDLEEVLAAADSALFRAKAAGRDHVCVAPAVVHEHPANLHHDRRRSPSPDASTASRLPEPVDRAG